MRHAEVRSQQFSRIAVALGAPPTAESAIAAVRALANDPDIPANLQGIGVAESDLVEMAAQAIGIERLIRLNPRPVTVSDLQSILRDAWHGHPAQPTAAAPASPSGRQSQP